MASNPKCKECGSAETIRNGKAMSKSMGRVQKWLCNSCGHVMRLPLEKPKPAVGPKSVVKKKPAESTPKRGRGRPRKIQ